MPRFDFRALHDRPLARDVARVKQLLLGRYELPNLAVRSVLKWIALGFFGFAGVLVVVLLLAIVLTIVVGAGMGLEVSKAIPGLVGLIFLLGLVGGVFATRVRGDLRRASWRRWTRLFRFAEANGMSYVPWLKNPFMVGSVFELGEKKQRFVTDLFWSPGARRVQLGNYRYSEATGITGVNRTRTVGFLSIGLDRHVPHLLLVAKTGRGVPASPLARRFRGNQVDLLEGDFPRSFTLYAPQGYGMDVRYLLTPDFMAVLVDEAGSYDVETIDDTLVIYGRKEFDLTDPTTHERLLRLVATVGAKTVSRTQRYEDHRALGTGRPAAAGRRLVWAFPIFSVIIFVIWLALRIWNVFN